MSAMPSAACAGAGAGACAKAFERVPRLLEEDEREDEEEEKLERRSLAPLGVAVAAHASKLVSSAARMRMVAS